jgi:transcription elongation factor Elf1
MQVYKLGQTAPGKEEKLMTLTISRDDMRVKAWTQYIKMKDGFECQKCHSNKNLQAHHCIPYSISPELAYDSNNGITLCKSCHSEFHNKYGRIKCSHYDISVFIGKVKKCDLNSFSNQECDFYEVIKFYKSTQTNSVKCDSPILISQSSYNGYINHPIAGYKEFVDLMIERGECKIASDDIVNDYNNELKKNKRMAIKITKEDAIKFEKKYHLPGIIELAINREICTFS